jgi:D-alanyl-lipoteichoic acid acyltransferase DltB (MBOAT superfamily)
MLFNSIEFALFLPIVFLLYWFVTQKDLKVQNLLLLVASYVFYGWWDYRFLALIAFSSGLDYFLGLRIFEAQTKKKKQGYLLLSLLVNLGFLGFFKYYNFFAESFADAFSLFGRSFDVERLQIILPVGISFYTFQTLSYSIDIYKGKMEPTRDVIAFFAFVSFFPQLVAGPIERASNLLPQFFQKRQFDYAKAVDGSRQILWGLFKKIVIADNCAIYANDIFNNYQDQSGSTLLLGAFFFTFQIYGDFSGYSDIAIGTSRLFGFDLMKNFSFPYFSRDIAEFWRRWHISLSTWFRDYLYIPLGGSKLGKWLNIRNVVIVFLVSGFWHGANWTFIVWGGLNALYFIPLMVLNLNRKNTDTVAENRLLPNGRELVQMGFTFLLTLLAWIFFRAPSLGVAFEILDNICSFSLFTYPPMLNHQIKVVLILIMGMISMEWFQRQADHGLDLSKYSIARPLKWSLYYAISTLIIFYGGGQQEFIYFQF